MAEWNWDWTKNQPPPPLSLFGLLPGLVPMETGVPGGPMAPVLPDVEKNRLPVLTGPGFMPATTAPGVVGTGLKPGLLNFGSAVPAGTPADPDKTFKEQVLAAMNDKNFTGALAQIAKSAGGGRGTAPTAHPMRMEGIRGMGGPKQNIHGPAQQAMSGAMERMAGPDFDLTVPIQKKRRGRQDYYDIFKQGQ